MTLTVTPIYAALVALLIVYLAIRVIARRRELGKGLGDAGDTDLLRRIRVHGNAVEYAPMGVVLLLVAELQGAPGLALHLLGLMLVIGRLAHAYAMIKALSTPRVVGMLLTFTMYLITGLGLLLHAII